MSNTVPKEITKILGEIEMFAVSKRSPTNKIDWLRELQGYCEEYISELQDEVDLGARDDE